MIVNLPNGQKADLDTLPVAKKKEVLILLEALEEKKRYNISSLLYPDEGPLRRDLYGKHLEFFEAGKTHTERLLMAGNRCGKTKAGGFETKTHLVGDYPDWWPGRIFEKPVSFWAAGNSSETTRDVVQFELLGPYNDMGCGLIPRDNIIGRPTPKAGGVPGSVDTVEIKRCNGGADISGGVSLLGFKCYKQGRKSFEGTKKDGVWFDEESPMDVYNEAMIRITSTDGSGIGGIIYTTFTPLAGLSEVVMSFLPSEYSFGEAA